MSRAGHALASGSLFSGYEGLGRAVEQFFGVHPAWFSEFDDAPSKILAFHYPDVPNLGDVTKIEWSDVPRVFIMHGGFPCQDVSPAGKRAGMVSGTRSGLWAEFAKAISIVRPRLVLIENVRGLLSADGEEWHGDLVEAQERLQRLDVALALADRRRTGNPSNRREGRSAYADQWQRARVRLSRQRKRALARFQRERRLVRRAIDTVLRDLADLGFDAEWCGVRASDVGAPHQRFRVFILAYDPNADDDGFRFKQSQRSGEEVTVVADGTGNVQDADVAARGERRIAASGKTKGGRPRSDARRRDGRNVPNALTFPTPQVADATGGHAARSGDRSGEALLPGLVTMFPTPTTSPEPGNGHARDLGSDVRALLPTPAAMVPNDGEGLETWFARRERVKETAANGSRFGVPLSIATQMLPTPRAHDFAATMGSAGAARHVANGHGSLAEVIGGESFDLVSTTSTAEEYEALWASIADQSAFWKSIDGKDFWPAIKQWTAVMGRPAPSPTIPDGTGGRHRLNPKFAEWLMGQAAGWITDPHIGLTRNEQLKACGNGVVTQQAYYALSILWPRVTERWALAA